MGNGMNKILPGLYLGNFRDSKDLVQIEQNKITHIISAYESARPIHNNIEYLCIPASDCASQDISQYFSSSNEFIHRARVNGKAVLVHCLAGVSRSVSLVVAYIMSSSNLGWRDALNAVRAAREIANPNFGFQRQLLDFQHGACFAERLKLSSISDILFESDKQELQLLLEINKKWVYSNEKPSNSENCSPSNEKDSTINENNLTLISNTASINDTHQINDTLSESLIKSSPNIQDNVVSSTMGLKINSQNNACISSDSSFLTGNGEDIDNQKNLNRDKSTENVSSDMPSGNISYTSDTNFVNKMDKSQCDSHFADIIQLENEIFGDVL